MGFRYPTGSGDWILGYLGGKNSQRGTSGRSAKKKTWGFSRVKNLWPHYEWNPEKFMTPKNYLKSPMNHSRKMTHVAMTYCGAKKMCSLP